MKMNYHNRNILEVRSMPRFAGIRAIRAIKWAALPVVVIAVLAIALTAVISGHNLNSEDDD